MFVLLRRCTCQLFTKRIYDDDNDYDDGDSNHHWLKHIIVIISAARRRQYTDRPLCGRPNRSHHGSRPSVCLYVQYGPLSQKMRRRTKLVVNVPQGWSNQCATSQLERRKSGSRLGLSCAVQWASTLGGRPHVMSALGRCFRLCIRPPGTVVPGGLMFYYWCFFPFFQREIFEFRRPIAVKLCAWLVVG